MVKNIRKGTKFDTPGGTPVKRTSPPAKPDATRKSTSVDTSEVSRLLVGTKLGNYIIQDVLGVGDFGVTYLAKDEATGQARVLKEYLPRSIAFRDGPLVRVGPENAAVFEWGLQQFLRDGRLLEKINNDAVVGVSDVLEGNGTAYLIMTHETGRDLNNWLDELDRPPSQLEHDRLVQPLLEALTLLHEKGVFHLEIMPSNILVRDDGAPVLIDFGSHRAGLRNRMDIATPTALKPYIAPEVQARDYGLVGPASDIYSLAAVYYLLVSGQPPPEQRGLLDDIEPAGSLARTDLRSDYLGGIDAGLAMRPEDRPKGVGRWQAILLRRADMRSSSQDDNDKPKAANDHAPVEAQEAKQLFKYADYDDPYGDIKLSTVAENIMDNPGFRSLVYGAVGAVAGALAGALASLVIASIVWSSCYTDSCVAPILPQCMAAGALIGGWLAVRHSKSKTPASTRSFPSDPL